MKCLFIYNPNSGNHISEKEKEYIINYLKNIYFCVDAHATKKPKDAYDYLLKYAENYDVVVVSGGDGTLNECVSALLQIKKEIYVGYIPSGTTNDVAKTLKIPKNIKKALQIIKNKNHINYDTLKVNENIALYECCFGMFTEISYTTNQCLKKIFKKIAYAFRLLKIWFKQKPCYLRIATNGEEYKGFVSCFFAINSKYLSGVKINKMANLSDGEFDFFYLKTKKNKISFFDKLRLFNVYLKHFDKIKNSKYISKGKTNYIEIENINKTSETNINIDGEFAFCGNAKISTYKSIKIFTKEETQDGKRKNKVCR